MMRSQRLRQFLLGAAVLSLAPSASASAAYAEALRQELGLEQIAGTPPGCQLCHGDDRGGSKTATKPFARSLQIAGATGANVPALLAALRGLERDKTDSDADGESDIDELRAGTDPNVARDGSAPASEDIPPPATGCSLAPSGATAGGWLSLFGLVACAVGRRRTR